MLLVPNIVLVPELTFPISRRQAELDRGGPLLEKILNIGRLPQKGNSQLRTLVLCLKAAYFIVIFLDLSFVNDSI